MPPFIEGWRKLLGGQREQQKCDGEARPPAFVSIQSVSHLVKFKLD